MQNDLAHRSKIVEMLLPSSEAWSIRFGTVLFVLLCASPALADGFVETIEFPGLIDVQKKRAELLLRMPILDDQASKSAISRYRQELERFNSIDIAGYLLEIQDTCARLDVLEKKLNSENKKGNVAPNTYRALTEDIAFHREQCLERNAKSSSAWRLYYELIDIYSRESEQSYLLLSLCDSNDDCRNK